MIEQHQRSAFLVVVQGAVVAVKAIPRSKVELHRPLLLELKRVSSSCTCLMVRHSDTFVKSAVRQTSRQLQLFSAKTLTSSTWMLVHSSFHMLELNLLCICNVYQILDGISKE